MTDILDEVLNEAKQEKRLLAFRKFFPIVIGVSVIIALAIAFYNWNSNNKKEASRLLGNRIAKIAIDKTLQKSFIIAELKDLSDSDKNRQSELAKVQLASELIQSEDKESAMNNLQSIITNKKSSDVTKNFAVLLWSSIVLDFDTVAPEVYQKTQEYLSSFGDKHQPFFATAHILKALLYQKAKDYDASIKSARAVLDLSDNEVSPNIKEQGQAIISNIYRAQNEDLTNSVQRSSITKVKISKNKSTKQTTKINKK